LVYSRLKIKKSEKIPELQTSHAILMLGDKYVLQLRDNKSTINAPGQWTFFGGIKKPEETPLKAIKREIFEELSIRPKKFKSLGSIKYNEDRFGIPTKTYLFYAETGDVWENCRLKEGQAVEAFTFEQTKDLKIPVDFRRVLDTFHNDFKEKTK